MSWDDSDCSAIQLSISDHKMAFAGFHIAPALATAPLRSIPKVRRTELNLKCPEACEAVAELSDRLAEEFESVPAPSLADKVAWVEWLCTETVNLSRSWMKRPQRLNLKSKIAEALL